MINVSNLAECGVSTGDICTHAQCAEVDPKTRKMTEPRRLQRFLITLTTDGAELTPVYQGEATFHFEGDIKYG
jgi:hypothetical protein